MKLAAALILSALAGPACAEAPAYQTGFLGAPVILTPDAPPTSVVFLFSGMAGWDVSLSDAASSLKEAGSVVVGVDLPAYLRNVEEDGSACTFLVSDLESLSQQLQRALGGDSYLSPIVAGVAEGGTLALDIAAQTPAATIGATIAVNPGEVLPLSRELCSGARHRPASGGFIYSLQPGELPDPVKVVFTSTGGRAGRAHIADLQNDGFPIDVAESDQTEPVAVETAIREVVASTAAASDLSDLPLAELPTTPRYDALAVIYSGDGGWRDLDRTIGETLQEDGVPVVGVDSLRYFWSEKRPATIAADLDRIIRTYSRRWKVRRVILIGYSFGADVLPIAFHLLPAEDRDRIVQLSLLGFWSTAEYQISVSGWLGVSSGEPTLPPVRAIKPGLLQCFYGEDEDESACPEIAGGGVEIVKTPGDHHFDGDYQALARRILDGMVRRIATPP